ncbi:hypothetical protein KIW84_024275 [Lathyrus oleraceus]|uniref:ATP-dependent DNA helicase n=1 Tax=Pisum sativum TaxID=3888 RepID=A0A9D5BCR1_PEA|nr:hypothetical protein KIW84_024275 [Pisum sativum]
MSRRGENERKRRQNMSNEQKENHLSRQHENYRRRKEQEKQAQTYCPINSQSRVLFQNFTNMTFPRSHFEGTQDTEVGPSRISYANDVALDDTNVDEAFEDAVISYVNMDVRENGALSRCPKFEGKHFRQHIRSYNHVLSFTSIGVPVDENILASGRGIYTFRAQGAFYHNIGGFYPNEGVRPRFLQLYIYDTDNELHNRIQEDPQLHQNIVHKLQKMLNPFNPFIRPNDQSMLLNAGRLLQQYVVDNYVKIESRRLRWIKEQQSDICAELYQGLQDALHVGETNAENNGKRTILPSSFIGGRRDMTQHYEDGMAIVLNGGKPNIFLTMTCNPSWSEITSELLVFQTPQDRPDFLTRIFCSKFEQLKDDVINKGVLGKVKSYMYVTEFQKHGLPNVHMLLVLESNDKLHDPKDYDSMVRAEIPKLEYEPQLHEAVVKHMIHGPCGIINRKYPCMKDRHCKKSYPKQLLDETRQDTDSYLEYRRMFDESISLDRDISIKSIKYLYKYVYKGPDRVAIEVHTRSYMDEVQQYVDARWICPTSWEYLLTNDGMTFNTFKKSAEDRGFLETDHSIHDCLVEATNDYQTTNNVVESDLTNMLLKDLNELLNLHGKKIQDYDLPSLPPNTIDGDAIPTLIQEDLAVDIPNEEIEFVAKLNNDQMIAFKTIMNVIVQKHSGIFFVDGLGGTSRTFLYRTLMASLRSRGEIVLATTSSGIAAILLPGGRIAHSRFKIPIDIQPSSICGIQKQKV